MSISTETNNVVALYRPSTNVEEVHGAEFLDKLAEQVRLHSRCTSTSIIATGDVLVQAKDRVEHGQFKKWVTEKCGFTIRTAQNYMRASVLATQNGETVSLLNPAALYRLSANKTPPGAIERVIEMLAEGLVPTEPEIIILIDAFSRADDHSEAEEETVGDQGTLDLACELHSRLGAELVSKLIASRWSDLRKCLRKMIEQSNLTAS